ncbi:GTP-binding protein [Dolichospermum sp. ST_con]|nr:GTP-binding protein [Dolichospermum sp. ST_con]MDD1419038.1 GTP-binding protein [Dolichospermum sp. ST_sed1]MDD1422922.1 GTP-binding protein [Dolichospermum sp. ST_sed9]MDD1430872.1 GTP-binding protein [Dolichospermum sp. ST_sed6]MDD1435246.1 GTP-binding protein [Dolichospermum sp. ST_sed10]MDD1439985.1 GTP-binding protein [Dolichospermum sp. ST_sed3]MDD1446643.1 GTP-binding protein [Dolichospermum sp. ST_sed8]MDD1454428.1 GTP-binding protein [Dolichospermum sp. ST_sed7]MDD1458540.1 GTP-
MNTIPEPIPKWEEELDNVIFTFDDIQAELNYKQAKTALRNLVNNIDLSSTEKSGLEAEIHDLETMLDKLESMVVQIAAFGMVGRGKSSLLNALVGQEVFITGPLHGVTRDAQTVNWSISEEALGTFKATLPSNGQSQVELIDTPGLDEVDGETRAALAEQIAKQADLILFVISGDMTKLEQVALSQLREVGKPIILVFNKVDQYPETDRITIYEKIRDDRVRELLSQDEIVMASASPLVKIAVQNPDGSRNIKLQKGKSQVEELKLKIIEILHREGKALVALNTMLYADNVNQQLVQRKLIIREENANQLIWKAVMTKALAIALNPVTVVDILSAVIIDISLILGLSKLYGIPMTEAGAVKLLQKIALSMGGIGASELLANLGLSGLKTLLGISATATVGMTIAPYLSIAITQAGVAGVSSYSIGQVTKAYLANGATWGPDGPKAVVSQILSTLNETSILNRIKDELLIKVKLRKKYEV